MASVQPTNKKRTNDKTGKVGPMPQPKKEKVEIFSLTDEIYQRAKILAGLTQDFIRTLGPRQVNEPEDYVYRKLVEAQLYVGPADDPTLQSDKDQGLTVRLRPNDYAAKPRPVKGKKWIILAASREAIYINSNMDILNAVGLKRTGPWHDCLTTNLQLCLKQSAINRTFQVPSTHVKIEDDSDDEDDD